MSDKARIKPSLGPITNARLSIPLVIGINAGLTHCRGQRGQQLRCGQDGVRERRPIQVVCRMHELVAERGGRVADQGHVIAQLHGVSGSGLNAGVGEQADGNDMTPRRLS